MAESTETAYQDARRRLHATRAELAALREAEGDELAKRLGYTGIRGIDAIHRFLIDKYHWLPHQVRALTHEELDLLLAGVKEIDPTRRPSVGMAPVTI